MDSPRVRRALISVSNKLGLADFARGLTAAGVEIFSTGGTRKHLENEGIPVRDVSDYTGFPEMMDGRLKTLHPKVHGGILCRHDKPDDIKALEEHGINTLELVVVNLYPFESTVAKEGVTREEAVEQIDIGGPTMVRAAAKNHDFTTIVTSTEDYSEVLKQIADEGCTSLELRRRLAAKAFAHTARYDRTIADFFAGDLAEGLFPEEVTLGMTRKASLRYGENPHQQAALYARGNCPGANVVSGRQLHGKELSYNNYMDLDAALAIVRRFADPAAVVIKHNNPCGAAEAESSATAMRRALDGDPQSAFGSVLGLNRPLDAAVAEILATPGLFIEAVVAPRFDEDALEILTTKPKWKNNVRLVEVGELGDTQSQWAYRMLEGGMLMQQADVESDPDDQWKIATDGKPSEDQTADLRFAWEMVRHVKSNAIVICGQRTLYGAGAGQMSRVDSVEIAVKKAGDRSKGAVLASDAFFPFPDSIDAAAAAGVTAVIQPGGSKNDPSVIDACNRHGLPMIFTARRHFKH